MLKNLFLTGLLTFCAGSVQAQVYKLYVAAESEDEVSLISFDAATEKGSVEKVIKVGAFPTETEGPHGIGVDPSGDYWYVTLGHGMPYGHLYKYQTGTDRLVDRVELGMFPATLDVSAQTGWVYAVNFNLHGDHEVSSLSVVDGETMKELARIRTGIMPHGSRLSKNGARQYHVSMMTDELYEVDAYSLEVSRVLSLSDDQSSMSHTMPSGHQPEVKPTWASPHPRNGNIYVAGNGNDMIYVVDGESWEITERWQTPGKAPYNLEPAHQSNLLVVSYKGEGATGVWDIETGEQLAKIPNSRKVTHGVVISPDDRYAFISVEGIGGEPGSVDVIDLHKLERVDVIETGKQASGIAFWKMEES
ncbi:MAG: YncE family protein [Balneolaceae bacterium]